MNIYSKVPRGRSGFFVKYYVLTLALFCKKMASCILPPHCMKKIILIALAIVIGVVGFQAGQFMAYRPSTENTENEVIEEKKMADPRITAAWEMMIGMWSSEDDRNFQREYRDDGTFTDSYASAEGETKTDGQWSLFTADNADDMVFELNSENVYVKQVEEAGTFYFSIINVTPEALELMNLDKGNMLRFGKMTTGNEMQDGEETLSASFRCDDDSSFVAEFPSSMDEVKISSEGEENVFVKVDSENGKKYENDGWTFFFQGEEATVTDRSNDSTKKCTPPFVEGVAPMNFGD